VEHGGRVVYRAKVKSPDYLRVLKLVVTCTYGRTVEMMDAHALATWPELEAHLRGLGREQVPEEVLAFYREHYDAHARYLADCARLADWGNATAAGLLRDAAAEAGSEDRRALRKAFAARAARYPLRPLLFAAFDGRLTAQTVREVARTPDEAAELVAQIIPA
jgi:hypothetical protein